MRNTKSTSNNANGIGVYQLKLFQVATTSIKACSNCKEEKELHGFHKDKGTKTGYCSVCKKCCLERFNRLKQNWLSNPVDVKVQICSRCKTEKPKEEFHKASHRRNGIDHVCKKCQNQREKQTRRDVKQHVLMHYSGGDLARCLCCGESYLEFLCIDHINGGGNKERKSGVKSGTAFYLFLKKKDFPPGYQTLCHNCNMSLGFFGYCPHKGTNKN